MRPWSLLLTLLLGGVLGCPSNSDDDDLVGDDDDTVGDDDDSTQGACGSTLLTSLDGTPVSGTTSGPDALTPPCVDGTVGAPEAIFEITPSQSGFIIASTNNPGTDFDTILYVLTDCEDASTAVECNDDFGEDVRSQVTFEAVAGTSYYLVVDGYEGVGSFELTVSQSACGDGEVGPGEMCDDGGTEDGDGCDAQCVWECVDDGAEDDDDPETATAVGPSGLSAQGVLCPTDWNADFEVYADFFAVTVPDGGFVSAQVGPGANTPCEAQEFALVLFDADLTVVAEAELVEGCQGLSFLGEFEEELYLVVFGDDQTVAPQDYGITVEAGVAECGNGAVEAGEECDDGGQVSGDGCSESCFDEDAVCTVSAAIEGNVGGANLLGDTTLASDDHEPGCTLAGGAGDVVYSLTMAVDTTVQARLDNPGTDYDTALSVRALCLDPGSEVACNDDISFEELGSGVVFEAAAGVTYYLIVDGYDADVGAYELSLTVPQCDDGVLDLNEECDDGNGTPGDGCELDCTRTPLCDLAPDQTLGALASGPTSMTLTVPSTDTLPDLLCSDAGGGDMQIAFEVATAGDITFTYSQVGDHQFGVFAADGSCAEGLCEDPFAAATGSFVWTASPGSYRLVVEAWGPGDEGTVELTIDAP